MLSCRVGRNTGRGELKPSCTLSYDAATKAVSFGAEDPEWGPSMAERRSILAVFGAPVTEHTGGEKGDLYWDGQRTVATGTADHFTAATFKLPVPFRRMPGGAK